MGVPDEDERAEPGSHEHTSVLAEELAEIVAARGGAEPSRAKPEGSSENGAIPFATERDRRNAAQTDLFGLAFSGGGIRSATFNLGVMQALAELKVLAQADYLSTVSGGGYIGAWLTAWVHRSLGVADIQTKLHESVKETMERRERSPAPRPDPQSKPSSPAAEPEAEALEQSPVGFLREHSNYLTPQLGVFGADTWSAVSIYLRNLVLNLTILVGMLLAVMLVPRLLEKAFSAVSEARADALAIAFLSLAACMSGFSLRFVRKSAVAPGSTATARAPVVGWGAAWKAWFPTQGGVLVCIVLPAMLAAFFIAAGMRRTAPLTTPELILLGATYLGLFLLLVLVWRPTQGRQRLGWTAAPRALIEALVCAALTAGLAVLLIRAVTASALTEKSVLWMTIGVPIVVMILSSSVVLHLGLMGRRVSEEVREWWGRLGAWLMILTIAWITLCAISLLGPLLVDLAGAKLNVPAAGAWLATTGFGLWAGRSPSTNGKPTRSWGDMIASMAPYVFVFGLLLVLSVLADRALIWWTFADLPALDRGDPWIDASYHWLRLEAVPLPAVGTALVTCLAGALLLSRRVDVNDFSLQPFYRNRLVRCYLGASNAGRAAHPFTGFDPNDDIPLADLALPRRAADGTAQKPRALRPYPLINVALNLVKGEKLAWQERKAASFTMAPLHCGFGDSYRRTSQYAAGRLTLGEAFATSGAAASPNMGYHSNPALAFLMTVFNVRLGTWLANPKLEKWKAPGPKLGLLYLMSELFGSTSEASKFVYLSDGGHFDNLGIYELVRRRCRFIIACDASADPNVHFDDLGAVIRKCRTDFGVDVQLDTISLRPDPQTRHCAYHCAVGKVQYPEGASGTLLYLKASLTGREPVDVLNYAAGDALFPHQSTADQWFSESQFESYRRLGHHCGLTVFKAAADKEQATAAKRKTAPAEKTETDVSLEGFFTSLRERWYPSTGIASGTFTAHAAALNELSERMRANPRLSFLDAQIYPSWRELMAGTAHPASVDLWLPVDAKARREGFYFCASLIQLMESVYTDLALGTQFDHPDNRGWMNLFRHWAWCGTLRVTWAITAATYGARFQTFCSERLGLDIGEVTVEPARKEELNTIEQQLVTELDERPDGRTSTLYAVRLRVPNPMSGAAGTDGIAFTVGFAVLEDKTLLYMRIQDHLRTMGLARDALQFMVERRMVNSRRKGVRPKSDHEASAGESKLERLLESAMVEILGTRPTSA